MLEEEDGLTMIGYLIEGAVHDVVSHGVKPSDLAQLRLFSTAFIDVYPIDQPALEALDREVSRINAMIYKNPSVDTAERAVLNVFSHQIRSLISPNDPTLGVIPHRG